MYVGWQYVLSFCISQINPLSTNPTKWSNTHLTSGVVYKFQCGLCNESYYGECIRHLNVRIGEHIGISPLTRKQVKPKNSSVADHLLLCNHSASYDDFSILTRDSSKFLLELKESLLILRDKSSDLVMRW